MLYNTHIYYNCTKNLLRQCCKDWLRSAGKAALQLCKIRESDWCMLLDSAKIKSLTNQVYEFYNSCKAAFSAERSH